MECNIDPPKEGRVDCWKWGGCATGVEAARALIRGNGTICMPMRDLEAHEILANPPLGAMSCNETMLSRGNKNRKSFAFFFL